MVDFTDRTAVVTGGGSGIGRETARAFADAGANVVVADVDVAGGEETVEEIEGVGGTATFVETDVTDADAVAWMVETAVETYGGLDFAFNNAGIGGELVPITDYTEADWSQVLDVNLLGTYRCVKAELAHMTEQGSGVIVNNASVLGKVGFETASAYVAAKHGVLGLTKTAALETGGIGVRVNAVCPGFVDTPMLEGSGIDEGPMREQIEQLHAVGRLGRPAEVAAAVLWLCSDDASFVTGEALDVDGGYLSR